MLKTLSLKQWLCVAAFVLYSLFVVYVTRAVILYQYWSNRSVALEQQIELTKKEQLRADAAEKALTEQQSKADKEQKVITKEVIREVEKPVYRECRTTDDGVRLIERAIDAGNSSL